MSNLHSIKNNISYPSVENNMYKRSERIASAVFLVSNLIPENEELRTKIRNISLDIVSLCVAIKGNVTKDSNLVKNLEKKILELMSFLDIAVVSGLISLMNSSILKKEFELFLQMVSEYFDTMVKKENVSVDFFDYDLVPHVSDFSNKENSHDLDPVIKDNLLTMNSKSFINVFNGSSKDVLNRKGQRGKSILDLINKKGLVGIKDITASIKGCSEKTIQRELLSLIKMGVLKKTGERRWSRYSVV